MWIGEVEFSHRPWNAFEVTALSARLVCVKGVSPLPRLLPLAHAHPGLTTRAHFIPPLRGCVVAHNRPRGIRALIWPAGNLQDLIGSARAAVLQPQRGEMTLAGAGRPRYVSARAEPQSGDMVLTQPLQPEERSAFDFLNRL